MKKGYSSFNLLGTQLFNCRLILTLAFFLGVINDVAGQSIGIYQDYVILNTNGGGNTYYYLDNNDGSNPNFQANLGSFTNSQSIVFVGGQLKTFKCSGGNVTGGAVNYVVWLQSGSPGGFTNLNVNFVSNDAGGCGGNQTWQTTSGSTNILSGLVPGTYYLEVYTDATGSPGTVYDNNSNNTYNYRATFSVVPTLYTVSGGGSYCSGGSGLAPTLSSSQTGVSYQLVRGGSTNVGSPITGTGSSLTFPSQTVAGTYTIVGTSTAAGTTTSSTMSGSAVISITPLPTIGSTAQPSVCTGTVGSINLTGLATATSYTVIYNYSSSGNKTTSFTSDGSGNGTFNTYQALTSANDNGNTLTITSIANPSCTNSSPSNNSVVLSVTSSLTPTVTLSLASGSTNPTCSGSSVTFNTSQTFGGSTPTYNFEVNGSSVQNSTSSTYTTSGLTNGQQVSVIMTSNNSCASPTTANGGPITMTIQTAISGASATTPSSPVCTGSSPALNSSSTGGTGITYSWSGPVSVTNSTSQNASVSNIQTSGAGTYTVTESNTCGSATATVAIAVNAAGTWLGTTSTDWNDATNWCGGVPTSSTNVVIPTSASHMPVIALTGSTNAVCNNLTLSGSGSTLTFNSSSYALTVYGTLTNGGFIDMTNGGTLYIGSGGTFTNNGTFTRGSGTVNYISAGTLGGSSAVTFNILSLNGQLTVNTAPTIDGTLNINTGSSVTASPYYTSNSTLVYNVGYSRYLEWNAVGVGTLGSTAGYPNNVTINTGTYDLVNGTNAARACAGTLKVNGGNMNFNALNGIVTVGALNIASGSLSMGSSNAALNVLGSLTNNGTLTLSSTAGGDLNVKGDFTNNSSFNAGARLVTFSGISTQSISGTVGAGFSLLTINGNSDVVTINKAITISNALTLTQGTLQFGVAGAISNTGSTVFNGGILTTGGYSATMGAFGMTASSTINLTNSTPQTLTFGGPTGSWSGTLVINNWVGNPGINGGSTSGGKIVVGALNSGEQGEINFSTFASTGSVITSSNELVPKCASSDYPVVSAGSNQSVCSGASYTFPGGNATASQYNSLLWSTSGTGTFTSGGTTLTPTYSASSADIAAGSVSLTLTGTNDCGTSQASMTLTFTSNNWTGATSTDWNVAGNWCGGVPTASTNVTIPTGLTNYPVVGLTTGTPVCNNITIISGGSAKLTFNNSTTSNTLTVNGNLTNGGTVDMTTGGTLTIAAGGVFANNGTLTRGTGTVNFAGAGTLNGSSTTTFNNLTINTGTVTIPAGVIIDGTFTINGGNVSSSPIYTSNSTLLYNVGYSRFNEWSATGSGTIGTTAGYPNNVRISSNSTLDLANGVAGTSRACAGDLTIDAGSTLTMNTTPMTAALTVNGNVNLLGTLTLSTSSGGDIKVGKNWNFTAGGIFNSNGRAVFFIGNALQTISRSSAGTLNFDYILVQNTGGGIQLSNSPATSINLNAVNGGNGLILSGSGTGNVFDLNGNKCNLTVSQGINTTVAGESITSSTGTGTVDVQSGTLSGVNGAGTLSFGSSVKVTLEGGMNFGNLLSTINGTLQINGGGYVTTYAPYYGSGSLLQYNSASTGVFYGRGVEWSAASNTGYPYNVQVSNNTILSPGGNSSTNSEGTVLNVAGDLTIDAGSSFYMDYSTYSMSVPLNVVGNININGNFSESQAVGGDVNLKGNWNNNGTFASQDRAVSFIGSTPQLIEGSSSTAFGYLTIATTGGAAVTVNTAATVTDQLNMSSGIINTTSGSLKLTNTNTWATTGGTSSSFVNGPLDWTLPSGLSSNSSVYNFPIGSGSTYLPNSVTTVSTGSTGPVVRAQATAGNPGGSAGAGLSSISNTEYWHLSQVSGNYTSGSISLTRQSSITSSAVIGASSSSNGTYAYEGGTANTGTNSINNSNVTGAGYYVMSVSVPAPSITSVVPTTPSVSGQANNTGYTGQTLTINGSNFPSNATVTIGGIAATSVGFVNSGQLTAVVGQSASGNTIVVTNPSTSATASAAFTYLGYITNANNVDWNTGSTWLGGQVPPTAATTTVNNNITINGTATYNPTSVTVNTGSTLTFGSAGVITITSTLAFTGTVDMTNGGIINFNGNCNFTNNGTFTYGVGAVNFAGNNGTSTVGGNNATSFYDVKISGPTSGINMGGSPTPNSTIIHTFTIGTGSYFVTHAPYYATNSTLIYDVNGSYNRNVEWSQTSGPAYPYNVEVVGGTTLNVSLGTGLSDGTARAIGGTLKIDNGALVTMNAMTATMTTGGLNLVSGGTLTLSSAVGGDYIITGNWINNGAFNPSLRAVQFSGSTNQTITGATTFDYLTIDNSAGASLNSAIVVNKSLSFTLGNLILGNNNASLTSGAVIAFAGGSTGWVETNGTGQLKQTVGNTATYFTVGNAAYNPIILTNTGTSDVYGVNEIDGNITTAFNTNKIVDRRWQVTETTSGGSNLAVKLQWNTGEEATNFLSGTNDYIGLYDGSAWTENGATQSGSNPYTFTSTSNFTPTNLTTGTHYFAIGKDNAFLCPSTSGFAISSSTNVSCFGGNTGALAVTTPSGGLSPYTYSLDGTNYQSSTSFTNLVAGTYTAIAKDNNGCTTSSSSVAITQPSAALSSSITSQTDVSCYGGTTGSYAVQAANGTSPYQYELDVSGFGAATTGAYNSGSVAGGSYTINIKDANGCTTSQAVTITQPSAALSSSITSQTNVACFGGTGSYAVQAANGTSPYQYELGVSGYGAATTGAYNSGAVSGGSYVINIKDANGCTTSQSITITEPSSALGASASNGGSYAAGETINLTSSGSGGTTGYSYSWTGPSSFASNSQNPSRTNATTAMAGTYTVTVTDANGCTASASTNVVVTAVGTYTWTGTTSTDWAVTTNWNPVAPVGGPNSTTTDVIIPAVTNQPIISASVSVGNVQVNSGARLTLNGSAINLNVYKTWTGGSTTNATVTGTGVLVFKGSTAQAIYGNTAVDELLLDNSLGAQMQSTSAMDIYRALDLKTGTFSTANGNLTFKSTLVTSVGIINNFSSGYGGTITGNINAERYYDGSNTYNQHFMGSPLSNVSLGQFGASGQAGWVVPQPTCTETALDMHSPYGTVFSFHESHGASCELAQWMVETGGNATNGVGYSVMKNGSGTLTLSGAPNLSDVTVTGLTNTNGWTNHSAEGRLYSSGWQLLSNPFLSTIVIDPSINSGSFDAQVWVWNTEGNNAGSYTPSYTVAPFQAFIVHKSNSIGSASYLIKASERVVTQQTFFQLNANEINITATNTGNGLLDNIVVGFNANATDTFDAQIDANKPAGALGRHTIYSVNNGKWMGKNILHDIATTSTIPVGFEPGVTGTYTLSFGGMNAFEPTSYVYLEDSLLHTMQNVRNGDYTFTANSNDNWDRFVLHFTPPAQIRTIDAGCSNAGTINIEQPGEAYWNYTLTDSNNAIVTTGVLNQNQPLTVQVAAGSYTLTLTDTNNYVAVKSILVNGPQMIAASFQLSSDTAAVQQNVVLTATAAGATNYLWNLGNGTTATGANANVSYNQAGVYNVSLLVTNAAGCSSTQTETITVLPVNTTGLTNLSGTNGPNVWSHDNRIYVDFTAIQKVDATVIIYDILGQQISSEKVTNSFVYQREIDNIEAAYMIVMIREGEKITTKKVFISNSK